MEGTSENSVASENVIVVKSTEEAAAAGSANGEEEDRVSEGKHNVLETNRKISVEERKVLNVVESEENSCVIDVKCGEIDVKCGEGALNCENLDNEKVCRICHLDNRPSAEASVLIQIGCGCKEELGIAHQHCAEAWFKLKGDRCCEICGESAKNITGVGDDRFMEEWNESRLNDNNNPRSSSQRRGFWQGQTFCNFLMACLVVAFVLPWFFRVNAF